MIISLTLLLLLAAVATGVGLAARFLRRPIPRLYLAVFFVLSVLPFVRGFVSDTTPLPLDHVLYTQPWATPASRPPFNPYLNDVATQLLPWAKAVRVAWKDGALPLRDRWNGAGTALAANSQSAAFSPFTLLAFLLPLARGFTLLAALKLLLAVAGMWLWLRELEVSKQAALFGAVAFSLSFSFVQWIFFPHTAVFCLWPWMLFLLERLRDARGRVRAVAALTVVLGVAALAGHPESAALGGLFAALWILGRWALGDLPNALLVLRRAAVSALLAAGLTAFLLIPSVLAIGASNRMRVVEKPHWDPILSVVPHGPLWRGIPTAFFPHTLGNAIASPTLAGATGAFPEMALGYFGIVGWAAALLFLRRGSPRRRLEWALAALLVFGFGVAIGQWPFAELAAQIPGIRLMFPLRFYSWIALAGSALAAFELDRFAKDLRTRRRVWIAGLLVPLALAFSAVLGFLWFSSEHARSGGMPFQTRQLTMVLSVLAVAATLAFLLRRRPELFLAAITALCGAELLYQWRGLYRFFPTAYLYPETPLIRYLRAQPQPFRVVGVGPTLFPNTNVFAGVEDVRTHDPVERRDYVAFLDATCGFPPLDYFKTIRNPDAPALDFLNVRYALTGRDGAAPGERWRQVYSGEDGRVFENARVLPRAFVPARVRLVASAAPLREPRRDANAAFGQAFREIAANPDWRRTAWVLSDRDGEAPGGAAEISDYRESTNGASFRARVGADGVWVVLSLVQDGGWSARDGSGRTVPVRRANGPFLAVQLPPGEHAIALRYASPGFAMGTTISATTAGLLALGAAAVAFRRRRAEAA